MKAFIMALRDYNYPLRAERHSCLYFKNMKLERSNLADQ